MNKTDPIFSIMLTANEVAIKTFNKKKLNENNLDDIIEVYRFFYDYIPHLCLELEEEEMKKIWNETIVDMCFKAYINQNHFKSEDKYSVLLKKIKSNVQDMDYKI